MQGTPQKAMIGDKAARELLASEKLLELCAQVIKDAKGQSFAALVFLKSIRLAENAIKECEAL